MKSGAKDKVSALRMLSAALKNKQIEKRAPLTDGEVVDTVRSLIKQRKDSIEQFAKGGRQDLVDKETAEVAISRYTCPSRWAVRRSRSSFARSSARPERRERRTWARS